MTDVGLYGWQKLTFSSGRYRSDGSCSSSERRNSVNSDSFGGDSDCSDSDCIVTVKVLTVFLQVIKWAITVFKFR